MRALFTRVDFDWVVASKGYTIVEQEKAVYRIFPLKGSVYAVTRPFHQFPGLFKQFAVLEPTSKGVVSFANKFGLLGNEKNGADLDSWFQYASEFNELIESKSNTNATPWSECRLPAPISINRVLQTGITTEISEFGIVVRPHSLLAAMALQLGLWFGTHDDRIGQCVECGATWVFGPGTRHRVSRQYCSTSCQDAARYRRKKVRLGKFWRSR